MTSGPLRARHPGGRATITGIMTSGHPASFSRAQVMPDARFCGGCGMATSKPPAGLRSPGKALWRAITVDLELDARERVLLEMAARQADDVAALEAELEASGLTTVGSTGQERLNAAVTELRQARLAVARLLGMIDLPAEGQMAARSEPERRARAAANGRWGRVA